MARRSSRIRGVSEKNEVSCMWGLFSILESCEGRPSPKVISNGRPLNRLITDYARKLDPIASFDEECRKIHNGDGRSRSMRSCHGEVMPVEKHKSRGDVMKTRKSSQEALQSSSSAPRLLPSTSAELSLNKLTIAAVLGAVCAQNDREESKLSEYFQKNCYLGKYGQNDEINFQQVQMRAKAFVDQMFIDRMLLKQGRNSESKSFSNALEVLSSKKALFMELLPDPNSMLARRAKDSNHARTDKDTVKSILECEGALVTHEGSVEDILWKKIDYQLKSTPERDSNKIVILKPLPPSAKHCKNVSCNCSSLQFSNRRVSDVKTTSFSFRKMKKKLKHTFGVARKDRSTPGVESECICDDGKKGKVLKNQELKSNKGSDVACVTDTTRRKLDYTSARCSNKHEFDVILEAKRHLSTRLNNVNSLEAVMIKKSPTTLERILSSPEPELWPFSPRRDGAYFSGSEMRFSPYNMSTRIIECSSYVGNELRSCDDHSKSLKTADARDSSVSSSDNMNYHGEAKNAEMNKFLPPESGFSGEVPSKTSSACITKPSIKSQKCDGDSVMLSLPDSLQQNDVAVTSTAESIKYQEEHRSPVSVLEPFFVEDANSPPSIITLQPATQKLQPRCLDFEGFPHYQSPSVDSWTHEDYLCQYVQSVIEASSLNWDQLSEITSPPEELLFESLFHEVELPPHDCYYDPKLLFDHINQVLLAIYKRHFCYPPSSAAPKIAHAPLAELVLAEILADGAEFFLLPMTERRTLDQLVSRDVASSRSWVDVQLHSEHIAVEISEALMEESLLDTLLLFHT